MSRTRRPAAVTTAAIIMWLMALLHLAGAAATFVAIGEASREFRDLAQRERFDATDIEAGLTGLRGGLICSGVVMVLLALLLAGLAYGVWRGNQPSRVITWIVCGLGVLCACCTAFGSTASFTSAVTTTTDRSEVLGNLVVRAVPDWAGAILLGSSGLSLLGYIATAVLLALPPSNRFFRKQEQAQWTPPTYPHHHHNHPPNYPTPPAHPSHPAPPPSDL